MKIWWKQIVMSWEVKYFETCMNWMPTNLQVILRLQNTSKCLLLRWLSLGLHVRNFVQYVYYIWRFEHLDCKWASPQNILYITKISLAQSAIDTCGWVSIGSLGGRGQLLPPSFHLNMPVPSPKSRLSLGISTCLSPPPKNKLLPRTWSSCYNKQAGDN